MLQNEKHHLNRYYKEFLKPNLAKLNVKSNLYTPGTHILIKKPFDKELNKFNLIILLAWNFKREILNYLKKIKFIGDIIIPLPKIKLVKLKK